MYAKKFNDKKYSRSSLAEVVLPRHLHAPFGHRLCIRPAKTTVGDGKAWVRKTQVLCDACAWLNPPEDFEEYRRVPVHWLAIEHRAMDLTKCVRCRTRHLRWTLPNNCTGCIRALLDANPAHLPAFPVLEAPRPLEAPKPRDIPRIIPAGAE